MLPYFPYTENGVNEEMIRKDFPDITPELFEENSDAIDEYYNNSLNQMVANRYYDDSFVPTTEKVDYVPEDFTPNPPSLPYFESKRESGETNTRACFEREMDLKWLDVRRKTVIYTADRDTENAHEDYYPNMSENRTKRDAFKHTIWNAFLCKYFWTVSSKNKRIAFAREVTNLWEACGDNGHGTRQMDYHNNNIGREIYRQESEYKKNFLGWTTGIENPSNARLKEVVFDQVENNSVFIDFDNLGLTELEKEEKSYFEIIKQNENKTIYLIK